LVVGFVIGLVPLVTAVLSILGLGAVVLAAYRTLRGPRVPAPVIAPVPA
jgi:multisubunit Na+/H+ antiporter MnhF subunit